MYVVTKRGGNVIYWNLNIVYLTLVLTSIGMLVMLLSLLVQLLLIIVNCIRMLLVSRCYYYYGCYVLLCYFLFKFCKQFDIQCLFG